MRFVFPWPLSPWRTLTRGPGTKSRGARFRHPWARSSRIRKRERLKPHGHDDADVVAAVAGAHDAGIELARQLEADLRRLDLRQQIDEVARVEADLEGR